MKKVIELSSRAKTLLLAQRDRYLQSLPDRKANILECWQRWNADREDRSVLKELTSALHKLAGSAGNFGLSGIGDAARKLEAMLKQDDPCAGECERIYQSLMAAFNDTDNLPPLTISG